MSRLDVMPLMLWMELWSLKQAGEVHELVERKTRLPGSRPGSFNSEFTP